MRKDIKAEAAKRLNRIEGQVRGIARMVEEDRYCIDIVTQIAATRAALRRLEEQILKDHVGHCVEHAINAGNKAEHGKALQSPAFVALVTAAGGEENVAAFCESLPTDDLTTEAAEPDAESESGTRPTHPVHPTHPTHPVHPTHPIKPTQGASPTHPTHPTHPSHPSHPTHPSND